ncbi:MAG TPA: acylphosphatase [Anaerolineae bacterium]|nr:acylphosphatase [Anaerolineae bacterium]
MKRMVVAKVYGRVQGVSFRYYTQVEARRWPEVTGWVRNEADGTVLVTAVGPQADLEELVAFLHRGSPAARVDKVEVEWSTRETGFPGFQIRYLSD